MPQWRELARDRCVIIRYRHEDTGSLRAPGFSHPGAADGWRFLARCLRAPPGPARERSRCAASPHPPSHGAPRPQRAACGKCARMPSTPTSRPQRRRTSISRCRAAAFPPARTRPRTRTTGNPSSTLSTCPLFYFVPCFTSEAKEERLTGGGDTDGDRSEVAGQ